MILPGEKKKLRIERILPQGAYLTEDDSGAEKSEVLLPGKQVPEGAERGDEIEVFIYRDSKDRLISTTAEPLIRLHEVARLKVREVTKIGAFLDMGLERDLLLPFAEQTYEVKEESYVLVAMYRDKSNRLAATMKIYEYLSTDSPYSAGDEIEGLVYEISRNFGAFVAVDNKYSGLIPAREYEGEVRAGDFIRARVSSVKEDGKLDISVRKKAYLQLEDDGQVILEYLDKNNGRIPFNDKADPELIRETFHMSKAAFKRAAGHLLKAGKIKITEDSILSV
ncbi:MAG: S1 RNA-binding domain-containing protein [Lachnospiraceae bacterium]|nr:S1 RNA-binding domain-containing protein [Lachnospiraceae bacterium]